MILFFMLFIMDDVENFFINDFEKCFIGNRLIVMKVIIYLFLKMVDGGLDNN